MTKRAPRKGRGRDPASLPAPPGMRPAELFGTLVARGWSEEDAEKVILQRAARRLLPGTGLHYRNTPAGNSGLSERRPVPALFWQFLGRATRSPFARASAMWSLDSFSFHLTIEPRAEHDLTPGDYQRTWQSVIFDRAAAEVLLKDAGRRGASVGGRRGWPHWDQCVSAIVEAIKADPGAFLEPGSDLIRTSSADLWSVLKEADAFRNRMSPGGGPKEETFKRELVAKLRPEIERLGYTIGKR